MICYTHRSYKVSFRLSLSSCFLTMKGTKVHTPVPRRGKGEQMRYFSFVFLCVLSGKAFLCLVKANPSQVKSESLCPLSVYYALWDARFLGV